MTVLEQSQRHLTCYQALLSSLKNKHGDTDERDIEKELAALSAFLPKLAAEIKRTKPDKALVEWNKGTAEAIKNYNPNSQVRPY